MCSDVCGSTVCSRLQRNPYFILFPANPSQRFLFKEWKWRDAVGESWFCEKTARDDVQSSMKLWRDRENNKTYGSIQQNKNINFLWWSSNYSNNSRAELNNFADFRGISNELEIIRLHYTALHCCTRYDKWYSGIETGAFECFYPQSRFYYSINLVWI